MDQSVQPELPVESSSVGLLPDDDARIESVLLDRPITSLTDIAYTYGSLYALHLARRLDEAEISAPASAQSFEWVADEINSEYLLAMTPDEKPDLFDEDDTLCTINIVLDPPPVGENSHEDDPDPRLHDDTVTFERLSPAKMLEIGYCYRPRKSGLTYDHSVGTLLNGKKAEKTAHYVTSRVRKWPTKNGASDVAEEHEDGWIIKQLAKLGEDDEIVERLVKAVQDGIAGVAGGEGSKHTCILSVAFWAPGDAGDANRSEGDGLVGPFKPGLVPVCNEVSLAHLREQFRGFGSGIEDSSGVAADTVTDTVGKVLGSTPGRPLSYYHAQQQGEFPSFDGEQSWQSYPLEYDTALAVRRGAGFMESCRERLGGGYYVHLLPYAPEMDTYAARDIFGMIHAANLEGADREPIANALAEKIGTNWVRDLRYYQTLINTDLDKKDKVITERPTCTLMPVADLDSAHRDVLHEVPAVRRVVESEAEAQSDSQSLFDPTDDQTGAILSGWYFRQTMYDPDRNKTNATMSANDDRANVVASVLAGEPVSADVLLESYVKRLIQDQREMLSDSGIDAEAPTRTATKQYVQFNALVRAGLVDQSRAGAVLPVHSPMTMTADTPTDAGTASTDTDTKRPANREERLEQHINDHDTLRENVEYRAAWLLGGLVARVSAQQHNDGVSSTVARRYPIDTVSRRNLPSVLSGVQKTAEDYDQKNSRMGTNDRYLTRIENAISTSPPSEWDLRDDVLQMAYGLGLSYGRADQYIDSDGDDAESNK